jgi:hypothetical protein
VRNEGRAFPENKKIYFVNGITRDIDLLVIQLTKETFVYKTGYCVILKKLQK